MSSARSMNNSATPTTRSARYHRPGCQKNTHLQQRPQLNHEEMGFTREQIVAMYPDVFKRFDFETREPFVEREKVEVERVVRSKK